MKFFKHCNYILFFSLLFNFQPCILSPLFAEEIGFGKYYALLIANQNYTGGWKPLTTPVNDVHELKKILENKYKFKVYLLKDATRKEIIDRIQFCKTIVTSSDNLLIYYAGHGTWSGVNGYWIGIDAPQKTNSGDINSGWINVKTITNLIAFDNGMKARHVLIIADSCYAGAAHRSDDNYELSTITGEKVKAWFLRKSKERSRTFFASGGIEKVLDRINGYRHSIFAKKLITYLEENNNVLDMSSLARKVSQEVHDKTLFGLDDSELVQTPEYAPLKGFGDAGGDFIFVPDGATVELPAFVELKEKFGITSRGSTEEGWSTVFNQKMNWNKAKAYCKGYNGSGRSDWRIPTLEELTMANRNKKTLGITDQEVWAEKNNKPAYFNFEFGEGKSNVGSNYPHHVLCVAD